MPAVARSVGILLFSDLQLKRERARLPGAKKVNSIGAGGKSLADNILHQTHVHTHRERKVLRATDNKKEEDARTSLAPYKYSASNPEQRE